MKFFFIAILFLGLFVRTYQFPNIPLSLHGDELGIGYNAHSLLITGRDEYEKILPLTFRNDFSPLIFYASVPIIFIFGLNEFSTRLPTLLIGIFMLPIIYFFTKKMVHSRKYALLSLFLVAVSSWHIRSSRIDIEMLWALFFQLSAIVIFLRCKVYNKMAISFSFFLFGLSELSYQSAKMTTPLIIIGLLYLFHRIIKKNRRYISIIFIAFIVFPLIMYFIVRPIQETRFAGISVFTLWRSMYPSYAVLTFSAFKDLILMIVTNYFKHFDPYMWFFDNASLRYYQVSKIGLFYIWQIPFIFLGIVTCIVQKNKKLYLLLFLLLISPLPASLTTGVPYANIARSMLMMPITEVLCILGIKIALRMRSMKKGIILAIYMIITLIAPINFYSFLHQYFIYSPRKYASFWGKDLKDIVPSIINKENSVNSILISDVIPQPYMYILFYGNKSPQWLFSSIKERHKNIGYKKMGIYVFRSIDWQNDQNLSDVLIVESKSKIPSNIRENKLEKEGNIFTIVKTGNLN